MDGSQFIPKVSIDPSIASPWAPAKVAALVEDERIAETMRRHFGLSVLVVAAVVDTFAGLLPLIEVIKIHFHEDGAGPMIRCDIVMVNPATLKKDTVTAHRRVDAIGFPGFNSEDAVRSLITDLKKSLKGVRRAWIEIQAAASSSIEATTNAMALVGK